MDATFKLALGIILEPACFHISLEEGEGACEQDADGGCPDQTSSKP